MPVHSCPGGAQGRANCVTKSGDKGGPAHPVSRGIFSQARIYSRYVAPQIEAGRLAKAL